MTVITETADAAENASTAYVMQPWDAFWGEISSVLDEDWVAISLVAGESYNIRILGGLSLGELGDPYMRLYNSIGQEIAIDGSNLAGSATSHLRFTATESGTFYIEADAQLLGTGEYRLHVEHVTEGTTQDLADFLQSGYDAAYDYTSVQFDTRFSNALTVNINAISAGAQKLALWALEGWSMVADLTFSVTSGIADITFEDSDNSGAYASWSYSGGYITQATVNIPDNWSDVSDGEIGGYGFQTYLHEIGHALGLGHQGTYNGNATYDIHNTFTNDSWQQSVMSYFAQDENTNTDADFAYVITPMLADIMAIQNVYGAAAAGTATDGDTVYGNNTTLNNSLGVYFDAANGGPDLGVKEFNPISLTLFDHGGNDTLDLTNNTTDDRIDIRQGSFSDVGGLIGNVAVAVGTVIEDMFAGSGNDWASGNGAGNEIHGNDGNDRLLGRGGKDYLDGGAGDDIIFGGGQADYILGGLGNDEVAGGGGADQISGGDGDDELYTWGGNDIAWGGAGHDILGGYKGHDELYGGAGNDEVWGGDGNDLLGGGAGNDTIGGGTGSDTIWGGGGIDRIYAGAGDDLITAGSGDDLINGGNGADVFIFNFDHGTDTIFDFIQGDDLIRFAIDGLDYLGLNISYADNDATVDYGSGTILLSDITPDSLSGSDFDFV